MFLRVFVCSYVFVCVVVRCCLLLCLAVCCCCMLLCVVMCRCVMLWLYDLVGGCVCWVCVCRLLKWEVSEGVVGDA